MLTEQRRRTDNLTELYIGDPDDVRLSVVIMPMSTVLSLIAEVAGHRPQGISPRRREVLRQSLSGNPARVLHPLFAPGVTALPDCLTPSVDVRDADFDAHLEMIMAAASERLSDEIAELYGSDPPIALRPLVDRPNEWLAAYARLLRETWTAYQPLWKRTRGIMDREIERVGTAAVRGAVDALLSGISPRLRYSAGSLLIPDPSPDRFELSGRRLVLAPTAAGTGSQILAPDLPGMVWLGYPLPGLDRPAAIEGAKGDVLGLVLGPPKARLLRELTGPLEMGRLAQALVTRPASVTYHVDQLEHAGLLYRRRQGRRVVVSRTTRGDALLDLLS